MQDGTMEAFPRSERLLFRAWQAQDLPLAIQLWGDPRVTALIDARGALTHEQIRQKLSQEIERQEKDSVQYWPIFLQATQEHVGCAGLRPYKPEEKIYELGFHLKSDFWGKGFAFEAAQATIDFAFTSRKASALFAGHHPQNIASRSLLEKLGFRFTHTELYPPTGLEHPSYLLTRE